MANNFILLHAYVYKNKVIRTKGSPLALPLFACNSMCLPEKWPKFKSYSSIMCLCVFFFLLLFQ